MTMEDATFSPQGVQAGSRGRSLATTKLCSICFSPRFAAYRGTCKDVISGDGLWVPSFPGVCRSPEHPPVSGHSEFGHVSSWQVCYLPFVLVVSKSVFPDVPISRRSVSSSIVLPSASFSHPFSQRSLTQDVPFPPESPTLIGSSCRYRLQCWRFGSHFQRQRCEESEALELEQQSSNRPKAARALFGSRPLNQTTPGLTPRSTISLSSLLYATAVCIETIKF